MAECEAMRSVPGAVATGSENCQLPNADCRLQLRGPDQLAIGNRQLAILKTRSLPLPVLTSWPMKLGHYLSLAYCELDHKVVKECH
jgi:hypothetical protein